MKNILRIVGLIFIFGALLALDLGGLQWIKSVIAETTPDFIINLIITGLL